MMLTSVLLQIFCVVDHASAWFGSPRHDMCIAPVVPPEPRSDAEAKLRSDVDSLLRRHWSDYSGYGIVQADASKIDLTSSMQRDSLPQDSDDADTSLATKSRASTYGEATPIGVRQIGRALDVDVWRCRQEIVFMDLGSGVGKIVVQAYLEWPLVARAIGVELSAKRCMNAKAAWQSAFSAGEAESLRSRALACAGKNQSGSVGQELPKAVEFLEGSILEVNVKDVTHAYFASLCFNEDILDEIARKLAGEATKLQAIATLRRFPHGIEGFEEASQIKAQMTWTLSRGGGTTTYIYKRNGYNHTQFCA